MNFISATIYIIPLTPKDKTIGNDNMNRFVGTGGYPARALG
jgi:hypothetical protein